MASRLALNITKQKAPTTIVLTSPMWRHTAGAKETDKHTLAYIRDSDRNPMLYFRRVKSPVKSFRIEEASDWSVLLYPIGALEIVRGNWAN